MELCQRTQRCARQPQLQRALRRRAARRAAAAEPLVTRFGPTLAAAARVEYRLPSEYSRVAYSTRP